MKNFTLFFCTVFILLTPNFVRGCEETSSYDKIWSLEARVRGENREKRQKHLESLTFDQRMQVSDIEIYPTHQMTCKMGFSEGLAKIFVNDKAGFINKNGKIVIKPQFKDVGKFSKNLAPFENENGKWGFIDTKGNIVIKPQFDWALSFKESRALVQVGEKWGYIDKFGNLVIKPQFDHANSFSEGLAHVQMKYEKFKSGYIDKDGNWIIQPTWDGGSDFREGLAKVDENKIDDKGKYIYTESFFINSQNEKAFEKDVSGGYSYFNEGFFIEDDGGLYTFIDKNGEDVFDEIYDDLIPFSEGLAYFRNEGKKGFLNKSGEIVFETTFDFVGSYFEGLTYFSVEDKDTHKFKYGFMDKKGEIVIKPQFEWVSNFREGFASVTEDYKTGYIDKTGKYIWKPTK